MEVKKQKETIEEQNARVIRTAYEKYQKEEMQMVATNKLENYKKINMSKDHTVEFVIVLGGILTKETKGNVATYNGLVELNGEIYFVKDFMMYDHDCVDKGLSSYSGGVMRIKDGDAKMFFETERPEIADAIEHTFDQAVSAINKANEQKSPANN